MDQYVDQVVIPVFRWMKEDTCWDTLKPILRPNNKCIKSKTLLLTLLKLIPYIKVMECEDMNTPSIPLEDMDLSRHIINVSPMYQLYFTLLMKAHTLVSINGGPWYTVHIYTKHGRYWVEFYSEERLNHRCIIA